MSWFHWCRWYVWKPSKVSKILFTISKNTQLKETRTDLQILRFMYRSVGDIITYWRIRSHPRPVSHSTATADQTIARHAGDRNNAAQRVVVATALTTSAEGTGGVHTGATAVVMRSIHCPCRREVSGSMRWIWW